MTITLSFPGPTLVAGARQVRIPAGRVQLRGTLAWPSHPSGLVIFARSGTVGPRDQSLAGHLRAEGMGTLLLDLLPDANGWEATASPNAEHCTERLRIATEWAGEQPEVAGLPLGYLGLGDHAAVALAGAVASAVPIEAVVVGAGRPTVLGERLAAVCVPTLLITGSRDEEGLRSHRAALARLGDPKHLVTIAGAGPQFEEPGALAEVGRWAASWFVHYLAMEPTWRHRHIGDPPVRPAPAARVPDRPSARSVRTRRTREEPTPRLAHSGAGATRRLNGPPKREGTPT